MVAPKLAGSTVPLTWEVETELLNGPWLLLGQTLPLHIKIKKLHGEERRIYLNSFQTQLIETTQIHAQGFSEISKHSWIIQSMANMEQKVCADESAFGAVTVLSNEMWASHALPSALTSSFEICNIKRSYQLEIQIGLRVGLSKVCLTHNIVSFPVIHRTHSNTNTNTSYKQSFGISNFQFISPKLQLRRKVSWQ